MFDEQTVPSVRSIDGTSRPSRTRRWPPQVPRPGQYVTTKTSGGFDMNTNATNLSSMENSESDDVKDVEIKVTIRENQELLATRALNLSEEKAQRREIYFFDTPSLALFEAGIILRARIVEDDPDNSTVKIRPIDPSHIAKAWKDMDDFKLEADWVGERKVCSASLDARQKRGEIDEVAAGGRELRKLFSAEQEQFLAAYTDTRIDFNSLIVLGPIKVLRWEHRYNDLDHEVCIEEWRLPMTGTDLIEISIKAPTGEANAAQGEFKKWLTLRGLSSDSQQETKTRVALIELASGSRFTIA